MTASLLRCVLSRPVQPFLHLIRDPIQIERVQYELSTAKLGLERLSTLYDRALSVPASTSSRCAATSQLYSELQECASAIKSSFASLPKALRTLDLRTPYLRGGGGRGFVTTAETADNKQRVVDAARVMIECVVLIDAGVARGARVEAAERKVSLSTSALWTTC